MKQLSTLLRGVLVLCLMSTVFSSVADAQTLTRKANTYISDICNGYYEYLPAGYTTSKKYPVIITFHGVGENGDGSPAQLNNLTNTGLVALLKKGTFPSSFTVNGNTYQFIIIAPQFRTNPMSNCDAVYQYVISHYPVDINRVYLTGYSQGGGNTLEYGGTLLTTSQKIAAMVPICPTVTVQAPWARNLASSNVPILATHNTGDNIWPYQSTIDNINYINSQTPPPNPPAAYVIFQGGDHNAWDYTVDPTKFTYNGRSMYEWMLQYSRNLTALPVVLGSYTAQLTAPSTVTVSWTTVSEVNNKYFILQHSSDGITFSAIDSVSATNHQNGYSYSDVDSHPSAGNNYYRLVQVDIDGKTTYFDVLKVVVSNSPQSGLRISPNPVVSVVMLQLSHPETGDLQVVLSDIQGRVLRSWKFSKTGISWQQTLDLGAIPKGSYTLQVRGTSLRETQQFVKQ